MTGIGTQIATVVAAAAVAAGSLFGGGASGYSSSASAGDPKPAALVIDASLARDGRTLVDPRLEDVDAEVRLPRTGREARTNVRYFDELGYRVFVAGPHAAAAAEGTGVDATEVDGLAGALGAAR
jgi:hypothetical protein